MQIDNIGFDYERSSIIKPPPEINNHCRTTRVVVDSRDRNMDIFPNPSQYEIELQDEIDEIVSVELCTAQIPLTSYNISDKNNSLIVNDVTYNIPKGNYTGASLASQITDVLSSIPIRSTYSINQDSISFEGDDAFEIGGGGTINKSIGLRNKNYVSNAEHRIQPEFRINLEDNKYVVMSIDQMYINNSINPILHKSFALLGEKYNYISLTNSIVKNLNPSIGRLRKMRVTFRDFYGNFYDFQNHDHRFDLLFSSRKHLMRYQV